MQFIAQLVGNQFASPEGKEAFRNLLKGDTLALVRDPDNKYDANAIKVMNLDETEMLGHINKEVAADLAAYLDGDDSVIAEGFTREYTCSVFDFVNPKKPTLVIEVTTGFEVDTVVDESDDDDTGED